MLRRGPLSPFDVAGDGVQPGETMLVTGASGGVGSAAVQIASAMGVSVLAVTSNPDKVKPL